jgi:tetratricopeptide (TPR) repeat protein
MRRLAYAQHGAGDSETAVATYRKLLAKTPDDPSALNGFAWFCASRAIALDEALPVALKAVELSNRSPGILDTLAELYYARGEYDKAIEIGKEALASDPDDQYFQDQVKKFKEAKAEADSQAMR